MQTQDCSEVQARGQLGDLISPELLVNVPPHTEINTSHYYHNQNYQNEYVPFTFKSNTTSKQEALQMAILLDPGGEGNFLHTDVPSGA